MKIKKIKDRYYRLAYFKNEKIQIILKFLKFHFCLSSNFIHKYAFFCSDFSNFIYILKSQIKNRCIVTNNSRSILRRYNVSRNYLRVLLQNGVLPGHKKFTW